MKKRIFITRAIPHRGIQMLRDQGYVVDGHDTEKAFSHKQLLAALRKHPYDAVLCLLTDTIDASVYDAVPNAKIIATYSVGYNNMDVAEAKKRGIAIANTPGLSGLAVAEHAIALMLGLTTRIVEADAYTRKGKYKGWSPMAFMGTDLTGKTIGLVGCGAIGAEVARVAHVGFNAPILYHDVNRNEKLEQLYGATYCADLPTLLRQADIVSLHVPLLPSTQHLMNAKTLAMMKPSAFLINTARGPVVDEKALVEALKKGTIAGAGLDVFEHEPKVSAALRKMKHVILTPHIASARASARNQMAEVAAQNIIDVLETGITKNNVWAH